MSNVKKHLPDSGDDIGILITRVINSTKNAGEVRGAGDAIIISFNLCNSLIKSAEVSEKFEEARIIATTSRKVVKELHKYQKTGESDHLK